MDTCPAVAARCRCVLTGPHDVHACDPDECGGQWTGSDLTGDMEPVRMPVVGLMRMMALGADAELLLAPPMSTSLAQIEYKRR
jgi:hypothetical protein